ncbi:uncharacterized protein B0T15DRAFT_490321 [Chaetomium strumarium]|uniref:Uncharacterized protein n=1 Tax=Chaetomium strumarium TaxID=1170767 RepID=A0AAJ0H4L3_9PEZI|nr:hypothetical protein B0T15DRAFT_490321 [Chaetomium strumarium]
MSTLMIELPDSCQLEDPGDPDVAGLVVIIAFLISTCLAFAMAITLYLRFAIPSLCNDIDAVIVTALKHVFHKRKPTRDEEGVTPEPEGEAGESIFTREAVDAILFDVLRSQNDQLLLLGLAITLSLYVRISELHQLSAYAFRMSTSTAWLTCVSLLFILIAVGGYVRRMARLLGIQELFFRRIFGLGEEYQWMMDPGRVVLNQRRIAKSSLGQGAPDWAAKPDARGLRDFLRILLGDLADSFFWELSWLVFYFTFGLTSLLVSWTALPPLSQWELSFGQLIPIFSLLFFATPAYDNYMASRRAKKGFSMDTSDAWLEFWTTAGQQGYTPVRLLDPLNYQVAQSVITKESRRGGDPAVPQEQRTATPGRWLRQVYTSGPGPVLQVDVLLRRSSGHPVLSDASVSGSGAPPLTGRASQSSARGSGKHEEHEAAPEDDCTDMKPMPVSPIDTEKTASPHNQGEDVDIDAGREGASPRANNRSDDSQKTSDHAHTHRADEDSLRIEHVDDGNDDTGRVFYSENRGSIGPSILQDGSVPNLHDNSKIMHEPGSSDNAELGDQSQPPSCSSPPAPRPTKNFYVYIYTFNRSLVICSIAYFTTLGFAYLPLLAIFLGGAFAGSVLGPNATAWAVVSSVVGASHLAALMSTDLAQIHRHVVALRKFQMQERREREREERVERMNREIHEHMIMTREPAYMVHRTDSYM